MEIALLPPNERERLASLYALKILDTPPEERFDRITRIAKRILDVPIVLISLIDENRQWFKSRQGLDVSETSRDVAFCSHAILKPEMLIVPDAATDVRFADNPLVTGDPRIRFYAGYPIAAPDGQRVGTLCVIDRVTRDITEEDRSLLVSLAEMAENELNMVFLAREQQARTQSLTDMVESRTRQVTQVTTELERTSQELEKSSELLQAVMDTVGEAIVTIDLGGKIVMLNDEVGAIFGYHPEELIDRQAEMLVSEGLRHYFSEGLQTYIRSGSAPFVNERLETLGLHKSGKVFPIEYKITETKLNDGAYFTISVRDISERKELEQMRDDFVSAVSHELRTPLASVMGWTETLLSEKPGPLSESQRRFLDIVYRSALRLDSLVEEILTVSRIQRGTLQIGNEPFYPHSVLKGVMEMIESTAASRAVTVKLGDEWPRDLAVIGDGKRMEQVLVNLVQNAVKFSPENSEVRVHSARHGERWHLEICDHGIGIAADEIPLVFERFYRAESARDAQIQGTGIGLYICKAIVDAHHGEISITSDLSKGTTVSISIPEQQPAAPRSVTE